MKYYEPSEVQIEVSIPERRNNLAGELLLQTIRSQQPDEPAHAAALRVAREWGHTLREKVRRERRLRPLGPERALTVARDILEQQGFEPYNQDPGVLALRNCPSMRSRSKHRALRRCSQTRERAPQGSPLRP
ncbi:MAG: hypothetical protein M3252_02325 [Actinomycetota bacterium]|nr:hypothetical protein [Actinomycetota bacterium]